MTLPSPEPRIFFPPFQSSFILSLIDAPISLSVDASDNHLGEVLQQLLDGSWAFYSKKLSDKEKKYSAFDSELLAAYSCLRHFRFMLKGREFTIFTDHKPHTLFRVSPAWSACQQCHLSYLVESTSSNVPVPGPKNVVADTFSFFTLQFIVYRLSFFSSLSVCIRLGFSI